MKYAIALLLLLTACKTTSLSIQGYKICQIDCNNLCRSLWVAPPQQCSTQGQKAAPEGETCCQTEAVLCPDDETVSPDCAQYLIP